VDTGDTAWVLASAALVLFMTPGLALFYGGMVRAKSVLNMMMMSFGALALISVLWVLYGYSMAFGDDIGGGLLGDPFEFFGSPRCWAPAAWTAASSPRAWSSPCPRWPSSPSRRCSPSSPSR
jgi:Amt family ammonium transporter